MKALLIFSFCLFTTTLFAKEKSHKRHHEAHEHGSGQLQLATEGEQLVVVLKVPAHDTVGFEHKPSTKAQKAQVQAAIQFLEVHSSNLQFPPAAGCRLVGKAQVKAEMADEDHDDEDHEKEQEKEGHSEFEVTYTYKCSQINQLSFVKVLSFQKFKDMKKTHRSRSHKIRCLFTNLEFKLSSV